MYSNERICAIIVTNGLNDQLLKCVDSVVNQTYVPSRIYLVDTGNNSAALEQLIDNANAGLAQNDIPTSFMLFQAPNAVNFTEAINTLTSSTSFDLDSNWIWLLHDDTEVDYNTLSALVSEVRLSETLGIVGSKQVSLETGNLINVGYTTSRSGKRVSLIGKEQVDQGQYARIDDVLAVSLNGALVNTDVFIKAGGLNRYAGCNDSLEFCRRVHLAGKRVIVSGGATIYHMQRSYDPNNLYKSRRSELIYRLATCRLLFAPFLWLWFLIGSVPSAIKQLYSDSRGSVKVFAGSIVGCFSWRSTVSIRLGNMNAKRVPRSVLRSLYATHKQIRLIRHDEKLENAANLWEDFQPTLLEADTLKSLSKKRRVAFIGTLLLLVSLTIVHFSNYLGDLFSGGHFESTALTGSNAGFTQAFTAVTSGFSDINFGYNAPVNGITLPLSLITAFTGSMQTTINLFVLLAIILAGLTAWIATGAATRNNSARIIATLVWVSLPTFTRSLDEGHLGICLAHILIPLLPFLIARGLGKSATDLNVGIPHLNYNFPLFGIVLAFTWLASPVLILPTLAVIFIAGFWNRRFWFALIPALMLNFWTILWTISNLGNGSWQMLLGDIEDVSNNSGRNVFQIVFGSGDVTNINAIICLVVIVASAFYLVTATRTGRVVLTRFCWLYGVLAMAAAILFERNSAANAGALVSIAYICFILTILIFLDARPVFEKKVLFVYAGVIVCVIILSTSYILFGTSRDLRIESDYSVPISAEKIAAESGNPRTLMLDIDNKGLKYGITASRTFDYTHNSDATQILIDNSDISDNDEQLRDALANMLSAPSFDAIISLEQLGIKAIFVPAVSNEDFQSKHEEILRSLDSTPGIIRIIEGDDRAFWRLPMVIDGDTGVVWDNTKAEQAYNSPVRYLYIGFSGLILLVFALLSLPFGKRKVIKYDA